MTSLSGPLQPRRSTVSGEVPLQSELVAGELAVNTADGKLFIKHTDNSIKEVGGGGGGSAVDSVNGETGVVSLGIQDMNDYQDVPGPTAYGTNVTDRDSITGPGQYHADNQNYTYFSIYNSVGDNIKSTLDNLTQSDYFDLTYTKSDNVKETKNVRAFTVGAYSPTVTYLNITPDFSKDLFEGRIDTTKPITFSGGPFVVNQLPDGSPLVWDESTDKFKIATLGIQEMDDFTLNAAPGIAVFAAGNFNDNANENPGKWTASITNLYVKFPDGNGQDQTSAFTAHDYSQGVYVSTDGVTWTHITGTTNSYTNSGTFGITAADWGPFQAQITAQNLVDPLYISLTPISSPYIPLAEGDVLKWNDTEKKFKPAQLSAGGGIEEAPLDGTPYVRQDADWVSAPSGGSGATDLDDLSDVSVPSPGDGQMIAYNSANSEWLPTESLIDWTVTAGDPYAASVTFLGTYDTTLTVGGVTPTIAGTVTTTAGKFGNAATFDGSSRLQYGTFSAVNMPADFTIDFWVKVGGTGEYGLVNKRNQVGAASGTWGIITNSTGWKFADLQTITDYNGTTLTVGQWHHLAIVRSGTQLSTYTDGVLNSTGNCTTDFSTSEALRVGNWDTSNSRQLLGQIDDLRFTPGVVRYTGASFTPPTASADSVASLSGGLPLGNLSNVNLALPGDGEVLTWNESISMWEPAAASGAVDSVNGETGVVSLAIEDLTNVNLSQANGVYSKLTNKTGSNSTVANDPTAWRALGGSNTCLFVQDDVYDNDLSNLPSQFDLQIAGLPSTRMTVTVDQTLLVSGMRKIIFIEDIATIAAYPDGSGLLIFASSFPGAELPWQDGDFIQYDLASQTFLPTQIPEVINKAKLQAEVAASTDFADFQARIAAL